MQFICDPTRPPSLTKVDLNGLKFPLLTCRSALKIKGCLHNFLFKKILLFCAANFVLLE
jgi:hypothetical protein